MFGRATIRLGIGPHSSIDWYIDRFLMCASYLKLGGCKAWLNGFAMVSVDNFMHTEFGYYRDGWSVLWHCWLGGREGIRPVKNGGYGGGGHWLVRMVCVSVSVNLPLHHRVQKFSDTGSPGWSRKKGRKTVVCVRVCVCEMGDHFWYLTNCPGQLNVAFPL